MTETILKTLAQIEQTQNIKILYAVESGSRAWGFASPDSDYDVRYIYIRRTEDYLRGNELRDTIEGPLDDTLDFSGWDIRKTLELLRRSNPSLMEWAQSPIVYLSTDLWQSVADRIPELDNFIQAEIPRLKEVRNNMPQYVQPGYEEVNRMFRQLLKNTWE